MTDDRVRKRRVVVSLVIAAVMLAPAIYGYIAFRDWANGLHDAEDEALARIEARAQGLAETLQRLAVHGLPTPQQILDAAEQVNVSVGQVGTTDTAMTLYGMGEEPAMGLPYAYPERLFFAISITGVGSPDASATVARLDRTGWGGLWVADHQRTRYPGFRVPTTTPPPEGIDGWLDSSASASGLTILARSIDGPTITLDLVPRTAEIILGEPDVYRFGLRATLSVDGSAEPTVGPGILAATVEPSERADAVRQAIRQVDEVLAGLPLTTAVLPRDVGQVNEAFDQSTYLLRWTVSGDITTLHVATHTHVRSASPALSATGPARDFAACYSVIVRDMGTPLARAGEPAPAACAFPFVSSALTPQWYREPATSGR